MDGLLWQWTDATRKFFGFACATLLMTLTSLEIAIWAGVPLVGAAFAVSTNVTLDLPANPVAQPRNIVCAYAIALPATALTIHHFDDHMLEMLAAVLATSLTMRLRRLPSAGTRAACDGNRLGRLAIGHLPSHGGLRRIHDPLGILLPANRTEIRLIRIFGFAEACRLRLTDSLKWARKTRVKSDERHPR